jgi:GTP-binding protein LepA
MNKDYLKKIRNFCIIAHIDHGKSTLSDRFLELTNTVSDRDMKEQYLDSMDLERERGITIKLQPVRMDHKGYVLNLIDTPGHVDFGYEVSRSLACCEGALLVVDATKGIQAQTLANLYQAVEHDLIIIPVINKIDLPNANAPKVKNEIIGVLGCSRDEIYEVSAKKGTGVEKLLKAVIEKVPAPLDGKVIENKKDELPRDFKSLIFDSFYDDYKGVVSYLRVFEGTVKKGDKVRLIATDKEFEVLDVGFFKPKMQSSEELKAGEVGYVVTGLKNMKDCHVGDTLASLKCTEPLPGYKKMEPIIFTTFYPEDADKFNDLKDGLAKLNLNDASLTYEPESSATFGRGFKCGFLGLLHLEIIQERLTREFNLDLVITSPQVKFKVTKNDNSDIIIHTPQELPNVTEIKEISEPWAKIDAVTPIEYLSEITKLIKNCRGFYKSSEYLFAGQDESRVILHYEMPLASMTGDFYDKLKSVSSGFASLSYEVADFRPADLIKVDILIAGDEVEAFSRIIVRERAMPESRSLLSKLKEVLPKQNFQISLQATVNGKVIARENISALRKDVTAKLYGGDRTRKDKLLKKQKRGKKRMKEFGRVNIPSKAFIDVLKK